MERVEKQNSIKEKNIENIAKSISKMPSTSEEMSPIEDIIIGDGYSIVLCEDGSVWEQKHKQDRGPEKDAFNKIERLKDIIKIMDLGSAKYALSSDGYIYAWGHNQGFLIKPEEDWNKVFNQPVRLEGISNVTDIEAKNGKAFALDKEGHFYAWGLPLYNDDRDDIKPGFPFESRKLVETVKEICIGAGEYHYFIRADGSIFSIMSSPMELTYVDAFIFPDFEIINKSSKELNVKKYYELDMPESAVRVDEGSKLGKTIIYEVGKDDNIELIGADDYTMFLYKKDQTLWYWNSNRIKYHDEMAALADADNKINYGGEFIKIDYHQLLHNGNDSVKNLKIVDICAGKENALFLTDKGQVFISEYVTTEMGDVEYYNRGNTNPNRTVDTSVNQDMCLKDLSFRQLEYNKIVHINTDGGYHFSLLDHYGNYFYLDMSPME